MNPQIMQLLENPFSVFLLSLLTVWGLVWKGFALWQAAKNSHKKWFIALLVLNTLGVLEIVYIFYFNKKNQEKLGSNGND